MVGNISIDIKRFGKAEKPAIHRPNRNFFKKEANHKMLGLAAFVLMSTLIADTSMSGSCHVSMYNRNS
jgi:hypothetical protein